MVPPLGENDSLRSSRRAYVLKLSSGVVVPDSKNSFKGSGRVLENSGAEKHSPVDTSIDGTPNGNQTTLLGIYVALLAISYIIGKGSRNQDPDKSEEQESARNAAKVKHQGWQTLDWTEPWSR